ncbi:hypothetical protein BHE74_00005899 [Ensete ventricosum]|nr:hypothetical protein GW17_00008544 [Ensete ventricosum]RWW85408.1 hypothetical protein BHE74_00005899 [Ensete ventricosum]RZR81903.1 hypothetical protein BHM03_00008210 [Ensete ventricosum]
MPASITPTPSIPKPNTLSSDSTNSLRAQLLLMNRRLNEVWKEFIKLKEELHGRISLRPEEVAPYRVISRPTHGILKEKDGQAGVIPPKAATNPAQLHWTEIFI